MEDLSHKIRELKEGGQAEGGDGALWAQLAGSLAEILAVAPLRLKPLSLGQLPPALDLPSAALCAMAEGTGELQESMERLGVRERELNSEPPLAWMLKRPECAELVRGRAALASAVAAAPDGRLRLSDMPAHFLRRRILEPFSRALVEAKMIDVEVSSRALACSLLPQGVLPQSTAADGWHA